MAAERGHPGYGRPLGLAAAITAVVVVLALLHPFKPSAPKVAAASAATGDAAHGKTLFDAKCSGCHGAAGAGGSGGPKLAGLSLDSRAIALQIAAGGGAMPAGLVSGTDRDDVVAYVRSIGAAPPAGTTAAAGTTAPGATTAPAASTAATEPAPAVVEAAGGLPKALAAGAGQIGVLTTHVGFLDAAFAQGNLANVRFHGEHLVNIALGAPARDLDGDGVARNPGDGVGLVGHGGRAYVTRAQAVLAQIAADPGVPADVATRARTASGEAATLAGLVARLTGQARFCAGAASVAAAAGAHGRIDDLRTQVEAGYRRLEADGDAVSKSLAPHP